MASSSRKVGRERCRAWRSRSCTSMGVLATGQRRRPCGRSSKEGMEAEVDMVAVNNYEAAQRLRVPGSPTIRVDGQDLFPVPQRASYALGCRTYATPEGLRGSPTAEMLREALRR